MKSKNMILLISLIFIAVISLGVLNAFDFTTTVPGSDVVIENMEFNIPDGYLKNETKSIVNQTTITGENTYVLNHQSYQNQQGDEINISIRDYADFDVEYKILDKICKGGVNKTLIGYPGYICYEDNKVKFNYAFNHKLVTITASNEDLINRVLVAEDA